MKNDSFIVRVWQSVDGSLKEFCGKIIIRFVIRYYWNEEEIFCILSIEKLGEFLPYSNLSKAHRSQTMGKRELIKMKIRLEC